MWASTRVPSSPSHQNRSWGKALVSDHDSLMVRKRRMPALASSWGSAGVKPKQSGSQQTVCGAPKWRANQRWP